jgi:UDP-N-acetylmuramate dehydrogenase
VANDRADDEAGLRGVLLTDEAMSRHVTWRAGGPARQCYRPADLRDLSRFCSSSAHGARPLYFVGLGSNLLVRDGGLDACVVFTHGALSELTLERDEGESVVIRAEAGVAAPKLARFAANHELSGAEFLAGIPGTVGGALAMNAGCYGSETWEFVEGVETIDSTGQLRNRGRDDFGVGYRSVQRRGGALHSLGGEWFVAGRFRFRKGSGAEARERIRALLERRVATQPINLPNAGSVFRNPPGDHAARLIEACGLKGHAVGGAEVSPKHANFIVNPGGRGSAMDIETLVLQVQAAVEQRTGIRLEPEVRIVGNSDSGG